MSDGRSAGLRWAEGFLIVALLAALLAGVLQSRPLLIIAWIALGLMAVALSPTMLIFGVRSIIADILIILAYAAMCIPLPGVRTGVAFSCGVALILAVTIWTARTLHSNDELHGELHGEHHHGKHDLHGEHHLRGEHPLVAHSLLSSLHLERASAFWAFIILAGLSIIFGLIIAAAESAALLIVAILALFAIAAQARLRGAQLRPACDDLFARAARLFASSQTVLLGVSGLLVLSLLVNAGKLIAQLLVGKSLYATIAQSLGGGALNDALLIAGYFASIIGLLCLAVLPAYVWYKIFLLRSTGSREHVPDWQGWNIGLVTAFMAAYFISPVLSISAVTDGSKAGLHAVPHAIASPGVALAAAACIFLLCAIISIHDYGRRLLMLAPILLSLVFFGTCIYYFFTSSFIYYAQLSASMVAGGLYLAIPAVLVLFAITIVFFITGFLSFLYEIWRD